MSEQLDSLELLVKIRSEGLENLRAVSDVSKAAAASAKSTGDSIDGLAKHLRDLGGAVKGYTADVSSAVADMVKNQVANAAKAAEEAEKRETNAIERTIRALEKKASLVGKTGAARAGQQQANFLADFKGTDDQINRVNAAFAKLGQNSDSSGRSFASSIRMWIQNPLYAAGAAAEGMAGSLGVGGLAILGITAVATAGGVAIFKLANSLAASSIEIKNFAIRIGTGTQFAQEFLLAAQRVGVNGEALTTSIRKLAGGLAEGGLEGKLAGEALDKLGIHARTVTGELRPMEQLFPEILQGLSQIPDFATRNVLSLNLLGRSYKELMPLVGQLPQLMAAARESGAVVSDADLKKADHYYTQLQGLSQAWSGLVKAMGVKAIGIIEFTGIMGAVTSYTQDLSEGRGSGAAGILQSILGLAIDRATNKPRVIADVPDDTVGNDPDTNIKAHRAREAQFKANSARATAIIGAGDPEAKLKEDQDKVNELIKQLQTIAAPGSGGGAPTSGEGSLDDLQKRLSTARAIVESDKAGIKYKEELKAMQDLVSESLQKELFGVARINEEYRKRVHDINPADSPEHKEVLRAGFAQRRDNQIAVFNTTQAEEEAKLRLAHEARVVSTNVAAGRLAGQRQSAIDIATGRLTPDSPAGIEKGAQDRAIQINQTFQEALGQLKNIHAQVQAEQIKPAGQQNPTELAKLRGQASEVLDNAEKARKDALYASETQRIQELMALDKRRHDEEVAAERQIANIQADARKQEVGREFRRIGIVSGLADAANPGNPVASAQRALQQRLAEADRNAAQTRASIDQQAAANEITASQKKVDDARLLTTLSNERGQAELQYEEQIAELQKKRIEEYRTQAHELAGALLTRGGLAPFIKGQVKGVGQQILGNALTPVIKSVSESVAGSMGGNQRDANGNPTGLGKLLQGTFLAPHDEQKITLTANTTSTTMNTLATEKLTKTIGEVKSLMDGSTKPEDTGIGIDGTGNGVGSISGLAGGIVSGIENSPVGQAAAVVTGAATSGKLGTFGAALTTGIAGVASFAGLMANPFGDKGGTPGSSTPIGVDDNGNDVYAPGKDNGHVNAAGIAAAGADVLAGTTAAVHDFKQGGAHGALGGVADIAATAAALDPEPISKAILGAVATTAKIVQAFVGDPKAIREHQIETELATAKYTAPAPINLAIDSTGRALDQNYKGQLRVLNAMPTASLINQAQGFGPETNQTGFGALLGLTPKPGDLITTQQRRMGLTQLPSPNITVVVHAMDSKSFQDHSHDIADAVKTAFQNGHELRGTVTKAVRPI